MAKKGLDKLVGPLRTQIRVQVDKKMTDAEFDLNRSRGAQGGQQRLSAKPKK
jgi:hypothetical protein